jgi:hypothetical protein
MEESWCQNKSKVLKMNGVTMSLTKTRMQNEERKKENKKQEA